MPKKKLDGSAEAASRTRRAASVIAATAVSTGFRAPEASRRCPRNLKRKIEQMVRAFAQQRRRNCIEQHWPAASPVLCRSRSLAPARRARMACRRVRRGAASAGPSLIASRPGAHSGHHVRLQASLESRRAHRLWGAGGDKLSAALYARHACAISTRPSAYLSASSTRFAATTASR